MNITLFGGAFDPPHHGHYKICRAAFDHIPNIDQLWLLPSFDHTFGKKLSPAKNRINMCKILIKKLESAQSTPANITRQNIKLSTIEIDKKLPGDTADTLEILLNNPATKSYQYSFIMGSDQLPKFHLWGRHEYLLENMKFYIYPRPDHPIKPLYPNMFPLKGVEKIDTSSTLIRQKIGKGQPIDHLVTPEINSYINTHHLYNNQSAT